MINTGRRWSFIQKMVIRLAMSLGTLLNVKMNTMWLLSLSHWKIRKKAKHKPKPDSTCWYVLNYITNYLKILWLTAQLLFLFLHHMVSERSWEHFRWLVLALGLPPKFYWPAQFPRLAMEMHDQTYADVSQHHGKERVITFRRGGQVGRHGG